MATSFSISIIFITFAGKFENKRINQVRERFVT